MGGYAPKMDAESIDCGDMECNEDDTDTCCDPLVPCSDMTCPEGMGLRNDAGFILASSEDAQGVCCEQLALCITVECPSCLTHACPAGYHLSDAAQDIHCAEQVCTSADIEACCDLLGNSVDVTTSTDGAGWISAWWIWVLVMFGLCCAWCVVTVVVCCLQFLSRKPEFANEGER